MDVELKTIRARVVIDIETTFSDGDSDIGTLLYCLEEDINDAGGYTLHSIEELISRERKPTGHWFKLSYDEWGCSECGYVNFIDTLDGGVFPKHCEECGVKLDAPKGY